MKNKVSEELKKLGMHSSNDFESVRDKVEREFSTDAINRAIQDDESIESSYTKKDRGIKASAIIDQWYDHQTNQEDINKAILKIEERANRETQKESRAKKIIRTFMSEGYFGYLRLRKLIDRPLEHPMLQPWYAGELSRIPSLVNPGGKVTLTEGSYSLSAQITAKANLVLEGNGWQNTELLMAAAVSAIELGAYDNITIRELEIDGNSRAYGPNEIIDGDGNDDITIERIYMHDHGAAYGIELWNGNRIQVLDSRFVHNGQTVDSDPVSVQNCNDVRVEGNFIYDNVYEYRAGAIELQDGGGRIIISNNIINESQLGIVVDSHGGVGDSPLHYAIVANNQIEVYNKDAHSGKYQAGVYVGGNGAHGVAIGRIIIGNDIRINCMVGDHGINAWNAGIRVQHQLENVTICNNFIDCTAVNQEKGNVGIGVAFLTTRDKHINISNNICLNAYQGGIQIENGSEEEINITGNTCYGCDRGIHIKDGDYIFIQNNNVRGNTTAAITVDAGKNANGWIKNNPGYNPVGVLATPFDNVNHLVETNGDAAGPTVASQDYIIINIPCRIISTDSGNTDCSIAIKDVGGNTIESGLSTYDNWLEIGWTINWGAFTGAAPTVTVAFK